MSEHNYDVVGLGLCPCDYICLVDRYPEADEKVVAKSYLRQGGGPVATAMAALGRWGASAAIIGITGDDDDGLFVKREFEMNNVDTRYLRIRKGAVTAKAFVWVDLNKHTRAVVLERGVSNTARPFGIYAKNLPGARIFHTDGRNSDECLKIMKHYKKKDTAIVMDSGSPRDRMEEMIALTDHFVVSMSFARQYLGVKISPEKACDKLLSLGTGTVVITLSDKGCVGRANGAGLFKIPAYIKENHIVDTTGAGDVFHAGYIYGLLKGLPASKCAEYGNAAAFLKCAHPGGRAGIPDARAISALLKNGV